MNCKFFSLQGKNSWSCCMPNLEGAASWNDTFFVVWRRLAYFFGLALANSQTESNSFNSSSKYSNMVTFLRNISAQITHRTDLLCTQRPKVAIPVLSNWHSLLQLRRIVHTTVLGCPLAQWVVVVRRHFRLRRQRPRWLGLEVLEKGWVARRPMAQRPPLLRRFAAPRRCAAVEWTEVWLHWQQGYPWLGTGLYPNQL